MSQEETCLGIELSDLFIRKESAWATYYTLSARNVFGLSADERIILDLDFEGAKLKWIEAEYEYRAAIRAAAQQR